MNLKNILKISLICFLISLFLECVLFNLNIYEGHSNSKNLTDNISFHNIKIDKNDIVTIDEFEDSYIEIKNINTTIKNLKLDFSKISNNYLTYTIYASDKSNINYYELPTRYLYPNIEKSKYIKFDLNDKAKKLKIVFSKPTHSDKLSFKINNISINEKIPFDFSCKRFILVFSLLFILYLIRPNSKLYNIKIDFKNKYQFGILCFTILLIAFSYYKIANVNRVLVNYYSTNKTQIQYYDLAKSFAHGKLYLEEKPSSTLLKIKNPYDDSKLLPLRNKYGNFYRWDNSFYKGKYYVYFGVVPVITAFLPYYLITGSNIPIYILAYIITIITVIGILLFLKEITKRYFKNIPFLLFWLLFVFLSVSLFPIIESPNIYILPIIFSLMFIFYGLYFMLSSIEKDKLNTIKIFFGSLSLALVAGCRPQLIISSFLLIPIFWNSVFKDRLLFSKKSIKQTIAFILPYILVAVCLMAYNYLRFGSITEFGINYMLTNQNMAKRGFHINRIGYGIFEYLFQLPVLKTTFPFISTTLPTNNYMGITDYGRVLYGGLFTTNIILVLSLFFYKFKKYLPKILYNFSFLSVIFAFIVVVLDTELSGIRPRYSLDFAWFLYLPSIFIIMGIFNSKLDKKLKKIILSFIIFFMIMNFSFQFLTIFNSDLRSDMINTNTDLYFKWYYLLQWWL